jgi:hypothetical protein
MVTRFNFGKISEQIGEGLAFHDETLKRQRGAVS